MQKDTYFFELQYCHIRPVIIDFYHEPEIITESHLYSAALFIARKRFVKLHRKARIKDLESIQVVSCKIYKQLDLFESE